MVDLYRPAKARKVPAGELVTAVDRWQLQYFGREKAARGHLYKVVDARDEDERRGDESAPIRRSYRVVLSPITGALGADMAVLEDFYPRQAKWVRRVIAEHADMRGLVTGYTRRKDGRFGDGEAEAKAGEAA